ncbi:MAG: arsenical pump-driving ATPase, partial [Planctomycetes bacterium]|nr:arsenical pump-driving ATPase [Planctomycetota bacterium]
MFFTGKGGVGKTSLACAMAVRLADLGKRVLLVSTDPASNLGQVFKQEIGELEPIAIVTVKGLDALNINPESAAQAYRNRIVGPVRGLLPEDVVRGMEEQLSGGCTTEIAAFDEFTGLLSNERAMERYDHILFDTAPTGHTLRLLQLPTAWSQFLDSNSSGASCLGPLSGLDKHREQYSHAMAQLADGSTTTLVLVARPLPSALAEASRSSHELKALGIGNQRLVINGVFPDHEGSDPIAIALHQRHRRALAELPNELASLPIDYVELKPNNMVGTSALRALLSSNLSPTFSHVEYPRVSRVEFPPLLSLVEEIASENHGMIMVLGKGGVGKTTIAAAIAVGLASRGHNVHLTTTDPAAHLAFSVESNFPNLFVDRIDPKVERERYRQHVLQTNGKGLDPSGLALLEEDLRSPCTEEIAV